MFRIISNDNNCKLTKGAAPAASAYEEPSLFFSHEGTKGAASTLRELFITIEGIGGGARVPSI